MYHSLYDLKICNKTVLCELWYHMVIYLNWHIHYGSKINAPLAMLMMYILVYCLILWQDIFVSGVIIMPENVKKKNLKNVNNYTRNQHLIALKVIDIYKCVLI